MKTISKVFYFALILCSVLLSCDKDDKEDLLAKEEEILTKKIEDIIPQNYLDSLKKWELPIHFGTTPPNVTGTYNVQPIILKKSNISSDIPGSRFLDGLIQFKNQSNKDFSINMYGKNFLNSRDTSIVTAISGSENKFTVYGKVRSVSVNKNIAITALILSGEIDGNNIKNLTTGVINIDNSKGGDDFIAEGKGRTAFDSDFISQKIEDILMNSKINNNNNQFNLGLIKK